MASFASTEAAWTNNPPYSAGTNAARLASDYPFCKAEGIFVAAGG